MRKIMRICQNCANGNNKKGKWKHTWRRIREKGWWHIYCELKKRFYPWDYKKRCFIKKDNI